MLTLWPLISCLGILNIDIDQCLHIFIDAHCFSLKLIVFHLGFNGKSKIWTRIYRVNKNLDKSFVLQRKLQDFNDNLRLRKWHFSENHRFEQASLENHRFSKENWYRGGTEKEEKSAARAASAIGVLRIFKSSVFAWRFFDFLGYVRSGMIGFKRQNWRRGGTEK
jgi:hypothetical protein